MWDILIQITTAKVLGIHAETMMVIADFHGGGFLYTKLFSNEEDLLRNCGLIIILIVMR